MKSSFTTLHFDAVWRNKQDDGAASVRYARGENERVDRALDILPTGDSLLDVGCGPGLLCAQAADRFESVFGIDIAEYPAAVARTLGVHSVVGDFGEASLPFRSESFDVLTTLSSLQYAIDPSAFLAECFRVLKPGGALILSVPNMRTVGKIFRLVVRGEFPKVSKDMVGYDGGTLRYFCFRDIDQLLSNTGFVIAKRSGIYCRPRLFDKISDDGPLALLKQEFFSGEIFLLSRKPG